MVYQHANDVSVLPNLSPSDPPGIEDEYSAGSKTDDKVPSIGASESPISPSQTLRDRWLAWRIRLVSRESHLWPVLFLLVLTVTWWGHHAIPHFATERLAMPGDSASFQQFLGWNVHALLHGENPFHSPYTYAPLGQDLGNGISLPYVSILVAPVTLIFGTTAAYNTALLSAILFDGVAVYLLSRALFGNIMGATLAGALATLSPYFVGHTMGHLNIVWIFGLPFIAFLITRYIQGGMGKRSVAVCTAITVGFTFGASTELVVTESFFAVIAGITAMIFCKKDLLRDLLRGYGWAALGGAFGVVIGLPIIIAAMKSGIPDQAINPPWIFSTDVTSIFTPSNVYYNGGSFFATLNSKWFGNGAESTGYLPFPLLIFLLVYAKAVGGRRSAALWTFALIALVFSLGPDLTFAGVRTVHMPWYLLERLPGLLHALPGRFSAFVFMSACLMFAQAWSLARLVLRLLLATVALGTAFLLVPNQTVVGIPTSTALPPYLESGDFHAVIAKNDNVLVLPGGQIGPGIAWIAETDFYFRMPTGNGGGAASIPQMKDPVTWAIITGNTAFDYHATLPDYFARNDIKAVMAPLHCDRDAHEEFAVGPVSGRCDRWVEVARQALGEPTVVSGGVAIWKVR